MVTIPEPALWTIIIGGVGALVGLARSVFTNGSAIKSLEADKQEKTDCLRVHGDLRVEIMAISKDVEALAREAGIKPAPSPLRNNGLPPATP